MNLTQRLTVTVVVEKVMYSALVLRSWRHFWPITITILNKFHTAFIVRNYLMHIWKLKYYTCITLEMIRSIIYFKLLFNTNIYMHISYHWYLFKPARSKKAPNTRTVLLHLQDCSSSCIVLKGGTATLTIGLVTQRAGPMIEYLKGQFIQACLGSAQPLESAPMISQYARQKVFLMQPHLAWDFSLAKPCLIKNRQRIRPLLMWNLSFSSSQKSNFCPEPPLESTTVICNMYIYIYILYYFFGAHCRCKIGFELCLRGAEQFRFCRCFVAYRFSLPPPAYLWPCTCTRFL